MNARIRIAAHACALWLRQLQAMTVKELLQLGRDRPLLIFIVYIFTINIVMAAGEASDDRDNARLLVYDADRSAASRDLVYRHRPPYFQICGEAGDAAEGLRRLDRGEARALLVIPENFGRTLHRGVRPAAAQLLIDTSKANAGYLAAANSARITAGVGGEWAERRRAGPETDAPGIENRYRIWFNPDLNGVWFNTIAELLSMVTVACILLPASAMVREKERGTIEQLLVSPLSPLQVMLSKVLSMVLVTLAGSAVSLFGIMLPLYHVPIRGSIALFFALTALYAFTSAGLGLAAATYARNSAQVGMLVLIMVIPIIILSGTHTPLESMPGWLRALTSLFPLRYYIEMTYGVLLRGADLNVLWDTAAAMAALGVLLFALGLWRFRRQFR